MLIKKILLSISIISLILIVWLTMDDHPLKSDNLKFDLFGGKVSKIEIKERVDFGGLDCHGDIFDFYEYEVDPGEINQLISANQISIFPKFSDKTFYNIQNPRNTVFNRWEETPLRYPKENFYKGSFIPTLLTFGNFDDFEASKRFVAANYLNNPGNYVAYYYPKSGGIFTLFILVPNEGKMFTVRKT